eukprot:13399334-Alexandrium_andersonii.AAC.1
MCIRDRFSSASCPLSGAAGTLGWLEAPGGRRSSETGVSASGGKKRPGPGPEASALWCSRSPGASPGAKPPDSAPGHT